MLKDMQIANQLGLSQDLKLAVTAAARDELLEQIEQGHGDNDYSAVARKYLPETDSASSEETQTVEEQAQAKAEAIVPAPGATTASTKTEEPRLEKENCRMTANETTAPVLLSGEAEEETQLRRRGLLRQLLRRASQVLKQPVSSKQE
jgi:hypothetical protein